jgi:hypothetical protein
LFFFLSLEDAMPAKPMPIRISVLGSALTRPDVPVLVSPELVVSELNVLKLGVSALDPESVDVIPRDAE